MQQRNKINTKIGERLFLPEVSGWLEIAGDFFALANIIHGGMGSCLKLIHENTKQIYALKTIHLDLVEDDQAYNRYLDELKIWITISQFSGVAKAYCITRFNELPCIVSRWMEGGNLRNSLIKKEKELFFISALRIANTLNWVHNNYGIIHRDLKPENILIDNNLVFVSDWGLAKIIEIKHNLNLKSTINGKLNNNQLTQFGSFVGTPLYASPEQIMGSPDINHLSDVYSFGCLLYEWETGTPPFTGNDVYKILNDHLRKKPNSIGSFFKKSQFGVDELILHCLEKNRNERPQYYDIINSLVLTAENIGLKLGNALIKESKQNKLAYTKAITDKFDRSKLASMLDEAKKQISLRQWNDAFNILDSFYNQNLINNYKEDFIIESFCTDFALVQIEIGQPNKAIEILSIFTDNSKRSDSYYLNLSYAYLKIKKYLEAESTCLKGIIYYPEDIDLLNNLVIALNHQNKFTDACVYALNLNKLVKNVASLNTVGSTLYHIAESIKNNNFPDAFKHYLKSYSFYLEALNLNPIHVYSEMNLSRICYKIRKYDESIERSNNVLNKSLKESRIEFIVSSLVLIAKNYFVRQEYDLCISHCRKWLEKIPMQTELYRLHSYACSEGFVRGKYSVIDKNSMDFLTDIILTEEYKIAEDYLFLAKFYYHLKDISYTVKAIDVIDEGLLLYYNNWKLSFFKAQILFNDGFVDDSKKYCETAYLLAPWREETIELLRDINKMLGNTMESIKLTAEHSNVVKTKSELFRKLKTV